MFVWLILSLLHLLAGYLYPVYASLLLVSKEKNFSSEEYLRWGSYWISLVALEKGLFEVLDILPEALDIVLLLIKVVAILFLVLPQTKGSEMIWHKVFRNTEFHSRVKSQVGSIIGQVTARVPGSQ